MENACKVTAIRDCHKMFCKVFFFLQQANCRRTWYGTSNFVHQVTNARFYSIIHQTQPATCKRFFGSKIEPSSCHDTRTEKIEALFTIRMDISPFSSKDTFHVYVKKKCKMYLCIKPKPDVLYSYIYSATFNAKGGGGFPPNNIQSSCFYCSCVVT